MIDGYLTLDELVLVTGLTKGEIKEMVQAGLRYKVLRNEQASYRDYKKYLYSLSDVTRWIKAHLI